MRVPMLMSEDVRGFQGFLGFYGIFRAAPDRLRCPRAAARPPPWSASAAHCLRRRATCVPMVTSEGVRVVRVFCFLRHFQGSPRLTEMPSRSRAPSALVRFCRSLPAQASNACTCLDGQVQVLLLRVHRHTEGRKSLHKAC